MITDEDIRGAALAAMRDMHHAPTLDSDRPAISAIFAANEWPLKGGYTGKSGDEYCGHTVAVAFRRIGDFVRPGVCVDLSIHRELAYRTFPSSARLANRGSKDSRWSDHGFARPVIKDHKDIQPGDIVVVVTIARKEYGDHITMATSRPDASGQFDTIEGNAVGMLGSGKKGKGVITRTRLVADVRQVLRITREHCVGKALEES